MPSEEEENEYRCPTCGHYESFCDCFTCEQCNETLPGLAHVISGLCEEETPCVIRHRSFPPLRFSPAKATTDTPARYASLELEFASARRDRLYNAAINLRCGIVRDGSLPDTGFEIVTPPEMGVRLESLLEELGRAITDSGCTVRAGNSWPCGCHVHTDARDHTYADVQRLMLTYAWLEPALFLLVPRSRRQSYFCRPCGERYRSAIESGIIPKQDKTPHQWVKETVLKGGYNSRQDVDTRKKKREKYDSARYSALNIHSWIYRGTVELRLFPGTARTERALKYAQIWAQVVEWSYRHTTAELDAMRNGPVVATIDRLRPILTPAVFAWAKRRAEELS